MEIGEFCCWSLCKDHLWIGQVMPMPFLTIMKCWILFFFHSALHFCVFMREDWIFFFNKMRQWLHYASLNSAALQEELAWLNSYFSFKDNLYQQTWGKNSVRCCNDSLPPVPFAITTHPSDLDCSNLLFPFVFQEGRGWFLTCLLFIKVSGK